MHYLTNYYKNLCEQLQEKLNILEAQINEGRYNPETGKIDLVRGDMWHPTDEEYAEYLKNKDQERKPKLPGTQPEISKPIPDYILPGRKPKPGDRRPITPDSKPTPKDPSKPSPFITPGITPSNPSKIPIDLFKPGKRLKGEPERFKIPTDTDRDDLFPGGRRPIPGRIPQSDNYFPTPGRKPESIIPRKPATKDQPIVPEPKPEEKDKIKNFIRLMRDGAKPGEKIKKTPSKTIYRDEEELPYIE